MIIFIVGVGYGAWFSFTNPIQEWICSVNIIIIISSRSSLVSPMTPTHYCTIYFNYFIVFTNNYKSIRWKRAPSNFATI